MSLRTMTAQYIGDTLFLPKLEREVKHIIVKDEDVKDWKHFELERTCKQKRLFNMIRRECDGEWYEWHGKEMPNYCSNCGARVIGHERNVQ